MSEKNSQRLIAFWIFLAFVVWIFAFRGFLSSKFDLTSDALSYYDHTKFFIENLAHGTYPLWDPYWYYGSPNDFFLRRIGAFNPFFFAILILKSIGVPYTLSYLWFLAAYYLGATIAFYLLAMRIYRDRFIAYAGFLMLLFSALGTRLFDSYMMLVTVPMIWFFYFLLAFCQTARKHFFLGMVLSLMILLGTYIPFYFLICLVFFMLLFFLIYFNQIPRVLGGFAVFFKENKILVLLSMMVLFISLLPAINFFQNSAHGQVVLPFRHGDAGLGQTLTVPHQTLDWGAVEDLMYSSYFSNLRLYKFAVVYVPFFSIVLFVLGFFGEITRLAVFVFLLIAALFCCIVPHGLLFYDFFYKHLFFLKYFRNLHFFIWFFLIPLFVLLVLEHWKIFTEMVRTNSHQKKLLLMYVFGVHLTVFLFVWYRNDAILSTYVMILLSLVFWSLMALKLLRANAWGFALLTLTILVQPLEVYHYFSLKANPHGSPYAYDFSYNSFKLNDNDPAKPAKVPSSKEMLYYTSGSYNFVFQNVSDLALKKYLQCKILLVDRLKLIDRAWVGPILQQNFLNSDNEAVIFDDVGKGIKSTGNDPHPSLKAQHVDNSFRGFKLLAFDANHLRFRLDVPYEKFLVYNDSYDPYWKVSINHIKAPLMQVNGAFKGIWVPAGKSIIEFSYGCWWQYAMNILLSIFAFIFLMGIIYYACFP